MSDLDKNCKDCKFYINCEEGFGECSFFNNKIYRSDIKFEKIRKDESGKRIDFSLHLQEQKVSIPLQVHNTDRYNKSIKESINSLLKSLGIDSDLENCNNDALAEKVEHHISFYVSDFFGCKAFIKKRK
jgi:hypothetical protein